MLYKLAILLPLLALPLFISSAAFSAPNFEQLVSQSGEKQRFEVVRKGKNVGSYTNQYRANADGSWDVISDMQLHVKIFLVINFRMHYQSVETWKDGKLQRFSVDLKENKKRKNLKANRQSGRLVGTGQSGEINYALPLLSSNHYNAEVINHTRILNTLTGKENAVTITHEGSELIPTNAGKLKANRYRYDGQLKDTLVWYTEAGQWLKLKFKAKDGSWISVNCLQCVNTD